MSNSEPKNAVKLQVPWQNFSSLEKAVFDAANRFEINKRKKLTISIGNSKDSLAVRLATETGPISVPTEQKVAKAQPAEQAAPAIPVNAKEVVEDVAKVEKREVKDTMEQQEVLPVAKSDDGKLVEKVKPQILEAKTADVPKMEEKNVPPANVPVEKPSVQVSEIKEGVSEPTSAIPVNAKEVVGDVAKVEKREVKDTMEQQEVLPVAKSDDGKLGDSKEVKPQILENVNVSKMEEKNEPKTNVPVEQPNLQISEIKEGANDSEPTPAILQKANTAVEDGAKMKKTKILVKKNTEEQQALAATKTDDGRKQDDKIPKNLEDIKLPKQEMVDAAKSLQSSKVVPKQVEQIPQTIQKIATDTGIQTDDVDDDKTLPLVSFMGFCPFSIGKHKQIKSIQVKPAKNHLK